jgi:cardiolipin synthase
MRHLSLSRAVAEFVATTLNESIESIVEALEQGRISLGTSAVGIDALPAVSPETARLAAQLLALARSSTTPRELALALRTAAAVRIHDEATRPLVEVVWSGPMVEGPNTRNTTDVILEMLRSADASCEVLVVGYSFTVPPKSAMSHVIDELVSASQRGAQLTFVLHREGELNSNRDQLMKAWSVFARKPRLLTWNPGGRDAYLKLHAKAIVIGRRDALVTSANLTFHGLEGNLELGLRATGEPAAIIAERFDHLIAAGVLGPWPEFAPH